MWDPFDRTALSTLQFEGLESDYEFLPPPAMTDDQPKYFHRALQFSDLSPSQVLAISSYRPPSHYIDLFLTSVFDLVA
jgi:hypothetical protein